jgi:hypothetical protein
LLFIIFSFYAIIDAEAAAVVLFHVRQLSPGYAISAGHAYGFRHWRAFAPIAVELRRRHYDIGRHSERQPGLRHSHCEPPRPIYLLADSVADYASFRISRLAAACFVTPRFFDAPPYAGLPSPRQADTFWLPRFTTDG